MGGPGSGTWYRWDKETTIEEIRRIDIRYLRKQRWLSTSEKHYLTGSLSWTSGGEPSGSINFASYHDRLELSFKYMEGGGEWQPVKQTIWLDHTPCHYGGSRKWLLCPRCNRRVGVLCGADKLFLCRHCYQIPYRSQNEGYLDRLISKKHKLGNKIFEDYDGDGWLKKKGMHWKTFEPLQKKYWEIETQIDQAICRRYIAL
ncbi:MAG: hypothetical protein R3E73_00185 [Porticoccaceae bacterium]|nr:hypothetical protein [Pseudomonadales bacterium]MCP5170830.1 hypothetical protein [Pseudomonadales bacterium]MCP5301930.1 hypothetical protein [Pseudomonadales bacterium]